MGGLYPFWCFSSPVYKVKQTYRGSHVLLYFKMCFIYSCIGESHPGSIQSHCVALSFKVMEIFYYHMAGPEPYLIVIMP